MNRSHQAPEGQPAKRRSCSRVLGSLLSGCLVSVLSASAYAVDRKPGPPEFTFSFESLNIPGLSANFLGVGASMMTLNFVDGSHLLLTYSLRELVPRLVGDPPDDDDRLVAAELVDLPSGRVLAKTRWHLHDHARYLWSLNDGRFLLREGGDLYTFAPLANLGAKEPFQRTSLPHRPGFLDAVVVSADGKLLTLETHREEKRKLTGININVLTSADRPLRPTETYDFYRLSGLGTQDSPLKLVHAGAVQTGNVYRLPIDGDGYLVAAAGKRGRWNIEFESFAGSKTITVGVVDSNCRPGLELVSPTQYLAFTCRSATTDGITVAAYDFAKNDIWEEPMGSFSVYSPTFAFAPASGRFAISRKIDALAPGIASDPRGEITTQEVRVYGTQTGDLLMKTYCVPVFRSSENFDLSPDGMRLGVIRNGSVEVYRLPELTKGDLADLAELAKLTPLPASGAVNLRRMARDTAEDVRESEAAADAEQVPAEDKTTVASDAAGAASQTNAPPAAALPVPPSLASDAAGPATAPSGDLQVRRKPPTLLKPGEVPASGTKSKSTPE